MTHIQPLTRSARRALLCGSALCCTLLVLAAPSAGLAAPLTQDIGTRSSSTADTPAYSVNHNDTLTLTGTSVTTTGARSTGLAVNAPRASIDIGTITTSGDRAIGLRFTGTGDSSATIGSLTTTGYQSDGVYARVTGTGGFTLDLDEASVGPASDVTDIVTQAGAINVTAGTIRSGGGGFRVESTSGAITVAVDDLVNTGPQHGVMAYSQSGAIDITVASGRAEGANGSVVAAKTVSGDIRVETGELFHAGDGVAAISLGTTTGDIAIEAQSIEVTGEEGTGIEVEVGTGAAVVDSGAITLGGERSIGIHLIQIGSDATDPDGTVTINSASIATTNDYSTAMRVYVTDKSLAIDSGTVTATGYNSWGLNLYAETGDMVVTSGSIATEGFNGAGILARSESGDITIDSGTLTTAGEQARGFWIESPEGAISLTSDSVTMTGDASTAMTIVGGEGAVTIDSGLLTSTGEAVTGIRASTTSGAIALTSDTATITGAEAIGVVLASDSGAITVVSDSLTVSGEAGEGADSHAALYVRTGSGDIGITSGVVDADGDRRAGLVAESDSGDIALDLTRVEASGVNAAAVVAETGGAITARFGGVIRAEDGAAIDLTGAAVTATVATGSTVFGGSGGVRLESGAGGATLQNNGSIGSGSGFAIAATGGAATIRNAGSLAGQISLTASADRVFNTGTWRTDGVSDFGAGDDLLENTGTLALPTGGVAARTVTFNNLERFNNGGIIDLADGRAGDRLVASGAVFNGMAGGVLRVDVNFDTGLADQLVVASATGVTPVRINPLGAIQLGSTFDVVDSTAELTGTEFVMADDNPEGLVGFDLVFAEGGLVRLSAAPNQNAFAPLKVGAAGQKAWTKTSEVWSTRMATLREGQALSGGRAAGRQWWGQAYGGEERLGQSGVYQMTGGPVTRDLTTESAWFGFQGGVDGSLEAGAARLSWGLTGGYGDLRLDFVSHDNLVTLTGVNAGAYGGVSTGPFFANLLVKVDAFEASADLREAGEKADFDGTAYGVQGEVGARFEAGDWVVEPSASLAWVKTDIDAFEVGAATIGFDDAVSLEGRLGLRASTAVTLGGIDMRAFAGGQLVREFEGDNAMTFATGGTAVRIKDRPADTYGRVEFGAVGQLGAGLQGFARGEVNVGSDVQGVTARFGASWTW